MAWKSTFTQFKLRWGKSLFKMCGVTSIVIEFMITSHKDWYLLASTFEKLSTWRQCLTYWRIDRSSHWTFSDWIQKFKLFDSKTFHHIFSVASYYEFVAVGIDFPRRLYKLYKFPSKQLNRNIFRPQWIIINLKPYTYIPNTI